MAALRLFLCSRNPNKLEELRAALPGWELELLEADGYPPEGGETYHANARGKALYGRAAAPAEAWVLGEDSGIEVDALGGAPGVQSARWADAGGQDLALLQRLGDEANRRARMIAHLVAIAPDGREVDAAGVLEGEVATERRGTGGFGYDPVFVPEGETCTVAELGDDWKRANSHRARAAAALEAALEATPQKRRS
ncbi:MAG: non-canonical purine NTP pyrophosphatase [Verrucomicrobiota bacterium]